MGKIIPPLVYPGSKGFLARHVNELIPTSANPYCEPYAGSAAILFTREVGVNEVLNDINGRIVKLFRVLQNRSTAEELRYRINYTPYAFDEYKLALEILANEEGHSDVDIAWAMMVQHVMSYCGRGAVETNFSRSFIVRGGINSKVNAWLARKYLIDVYCWRLEHVVIDHLDAIEAIKKWDNKDAGFYVDPPYVMGERTQKHLYEHDTCDSDAEFEHHNRLIDALISASGTVVVSNYDNPIYRRLEEHGFTRIELSRKTTMAYSYAQDRAPRPFRREVLWYRKSY